MNSIPERVAVLESQGRAIFDKLTHLDLCVDGLKRAVWQASGAAAILIGIIQLIK